jgi:uncharacterized protein YdeI (YjbR/CyaY-like superfamily)
MQLPRLIALSHHWFRYKDVAMEITQTLHVTDRREWRKWLREHHKKEKEIWLVYYKKHTGRPRISYNDAVEEALCFGWIDSTLKSLDEDRSAQRFSPRKPGSTYSQANKERLRHLASQRKLTKPIKESVTDILIEKFSIAPDILEAIRSEEQAWKIYQKFTESYKRIRIAFIEGARGRPDEFKKRLRYFIKMTALNKQFGFGGIEKHYK